MIESKEIKPFIKWAGGKGQILKFISSRYPKDINTITKYCEPFVGGGAVLFDILSRFNFKEILINDINKELINSYKQIRDNNKELIICLKDLEKEYCNLDNNDRNVFYYDKRKKFNFLKLNGDNSVNTEKAVLFIFLNRTCYNGLFRVNKNGYFNVPAGHYKNPKILDEKNIVNVSNALQKAEIISKDYEECFNFIDEKSFVYIDPPYRPISSTSNFTAYNESSFDDCEQIRLKDFIDKINRKNAKILISNSDPRNFNENDDFFDDVYKNYIIERTEAKRMINCNGENRGNIKELMIRNYEV